MALELALDWPSERAHLVQIAINEIYGPGMMLNYTDNEIEM